MIQYLIYFEYTLVVIYLKKKVALLFGGKSFEHDVSIKSAISIFENIDLNKFELQGIYVDKENKFYKSKIYDLSENKVIDNIISYLKKFDIVFPIIHGKYGEDGKLQGMLDFFDIKYVGSKTIGSAIGMDKEISKIIFKSLGIPVIPYKVTNYVDCDINDIEKLGYPMIVKPVNGGSSIGVSKVENKKQLFKAIKYANKFDTRVIIEKFIKAQELECAILEDKEIYVSDVGEIIIDDGFYDYDAKYKNETSTLLSANIDDSIKDKIKEYAKKAFIGINAKNFSRVDFFYDGENIYINEINTLPGFTNISMYPKLMENKCSYRKLITKLLSI